MFGDVLKYGNQRRGDEETVYTTDITHSISLLVFEIDLNLDLGFNLEPHTLVKSC